MTDTGCKSVPPLFWSFSPSLRRACLLYFCNDFFLQFAFLNDISFLSENGLEWREGRCRSADKSAWDMSRHTAGYRSAEAVLRTNQDHFSAFAIIRFRSRNPVTFVVAKMVHGQAHKRRPPSRHVVDACRTGFWDAEDEELPYAVGSSEDGALTAALVTRSGRSIRYSMQLEYPLIVRPSSTRFQAIRSIGLAAVRTGTNDLCPAVPCDGVKARRTVLYHGV